ncbi:MAG TPA: hybrid sensor histidine kinase/response regulator [Kofleriaceae bacterium]|nr:hybrid sensor histidine kinase/response regulator [Kofleriaceae bacterium]
MRLREFQWDDTPLGSPTTWPVSLRTAASICFASKQPMAIVWGIEHTLLYNEACAKLIGLIDHTSAIARSGRSLQPWRSLVDAVDVVLAGQDPAAAEELAHDILNVTFTLTPIYSEGVRAEGVLVELHDGARVDVEQRAKDDFLSLFGHELRNPLSAITASLQVLVRQSPSVEVMVIDRSIRHLTRLVDDLLDASRLRRGKLELRRTTLEIAQVIDLSLERLSRTFEETKTQVFVRVPRSGLGVDCDPERMAQVFTNVLHNAAKYSDPGSVVNVEAERSGESVRIRIRDSGPGIESHALEQIFEPFNGARPTNAGLGLGLGISRKLVELHSGKLAIRSDGGGSGTEVVIELPHTPAPDGALIPPINLERRKRVLLVEDNHDTAVALQRALETLGYQVALAHNGPVALTVARTFQPDVALLDINLPVMDGWELSKRLRELKVPSRELHFVAVTARDQEQDKQRSADAGFADHLVKPIDLNKLERVVENLPDPA